MARKAQKDVEKKEESLATPADALVTPAEELDSGVKLIPRDKLQERIEQLQSLTKITNDNQVEIAFEGQPKKDFIEAFESGYPVIEKALASLYDLGHFLYGVRAKLKPAKLYHAWLEYAGIPQGTARNYVQAYERYREQLPRFASLGIKKLLIASRLPNCVEYVAEHEEAIAACTADEFAKKVGKLQQERKRASKGGRIDSCIEIGGFRIRPSHDGHRVTIEGTDKSQQTKLIEELKELLSNLKD